MSAPPELVHVVRDGVAESVHRGHVAVASAEGEVLAAVGDAEVPVYVRSAAKPFQAVATLSLLGATGASLDGDAVAIMCASHDGSDEHQIEAARLLAEADLDESALRCPPALPADVPTLLTHDGPTRLAHNCSGKHAGFLLAQVAGGADPTGYLDADQPLQRRVREVLADLADADPEGPGVDGCGAPAWRLPLSALAVAFARLAAAGEEPLRRIRQAMTARPDLVGGTQAVDTLLMQSDSRVVAKRGAEAVLAAGLGGAHGPLGIAVKIADGGHRACGPALAAVLHALGARVPADVLRPAVLGGGRPRGSLEVTAALAAGDFASKR